MDRSVAFYRDVLGLAVRFSSPYWSEVKIGDANLGLHPALEGSAEPLGQYGKGWMLGLQTDDIRALRARLTEYGASIRGEYHDVPGGVVLDFSDPDGNPIEAIQMGITSKDL